MRCGAAGIIIYKRNFLGRVRFLGLKATRRFAKRGKGKYDIPKGKRDRGETPLECARRECFEEAGLKPENIVAGPFKSGDGLWVWLAECNGKPKIGVNPQSGCKEHLGYRWLSPNQLEKDCLKYLRPSIAWAKKELRR